MLGLQDTKFEIKATTSFKKQLKKILKQGHDINKLIDVLNILAEGEKLDTKYKEYNLINDKYYNNCEECHIEPDWLLIYKYTQDELILLLVSTGSHSELFK